MQVVLEAHNSTHCCYSQDGDPVSGKEVGLVKNWTLNSFPKAVGNYSIKGYGQLKDD